MSNSTQDVSLRTFFEPGMFEVHEPDDTAAVTNPPPQPERRVTGKRTGVKLMNNTPTGTSQHVAQSAGGNLAHAPGNDTRFGALLELSGKLGATVGEADDVQIKLLLAVVQAAFEGVIDNTVDKHGAGIDDAVKITEAHWKARNNKVIFNPKAGNQRKTASCTRQCITLGGWSKGGPSEPIGMVNKAMSQYQTLRKNPTTAKKLLDAGNYLIVIARKMKRSDHVLTKDELNDLAFKVDPNSTTIEDVLDGIRKNLTKLRDGKHSAGQCATPNVEAALKAVSRELKAIADGRRQHDADDAAADIAAAADAQSKTGDRAGVAAPGGPAN